MCDRDPNHDGSFSPPLAPPIAPPTTVSTAHPPTALVSQRAETHLYKSGAVPPPASSVVTTTPFDCGTARAGRWITFTNRAANPVRINLCSLDFNKEICKGGAPGANDTYTTCDTTGANRGADALSFIPANSSVA